MRETKPLVGTVFRVESWKFERVISASGEYDGLRYGGAVDLIGALVSFDSGSDFTSPAKGA